MTLIERLNERAEAERRFVGGALESPETLAALEDAARTLAQAAAWFDEYAALHDAKPDPEKAARNRERAAACRQGISQ
jgi:hypothetical protein